MRKSIIIALALICAVASAQDKKSDWAQFYRYSAANATIEKRPKAVLMGDSITDNWLKQRPEFFRAYNLAGRGISGQTSSEMLVRFRRDVLDLKPKYVLILAGTNDCAENNGKMAPENTLGNIVSMCEIAKRHRIKPVICSVLPVGSFRWRPEVRDATERVIYLNSLLRDYAQKNRIPYLDYFVLMADENGALPEHLSSDSVHPNGAGYDIMEDAVKAFLKLK